MSQTGFACTQEWTPGPVVLILRVWCKDRVYDLTKYSAVAERTLGHFTNRPQEALVSVTPTTIPRSLQCSVHEEPGLVISWSQFTAVSLDMSGEKGRFEDVDHFWRQRILGLEVVR